MFKEVKGVATSKYRWHWLTVLLLLWKITKNFVLFQRTAAESSKKYKKLPPQPYESGEEETFASDWKPVLSKSTYYYPPVYPPVKAHIRKTTTLAPPKKEKTTPTTRTKPTPKPLPIHEAIDITTVFPPKKASLSPSVYKGNLKRVNHMNYFNYKITPGGDSIVTAESKQKETVELPRRRPVKKQTQPKKADGGYQVHEDVEGDIKPPRYTSFNALSPSVMKSVPLYPAFEDNQIVDVAKTANKTSIVESYGKRLKGRRSNKSSSQ